MLLLAAAVNCMVLVLPVWVVENPGAGSAARLYGTKISLEGTAAQTIDPEITVGDDFLLLVHLIFVIFASGFLLFIIFSYGDRIKQMRLAYLAIVMICVQIVVAVILSNGLGSRINLSEASAGEFDVGFFAPIVAVLFAWLSARRMKQDEDLVRSADRFR